MSKAKKNKQVFSNDEIRKRILNYLGTRRQIVRGIDSLMASSSDIKKALVKEGVGQNETVRNLDYLVQHGWVKREIVSRPYTTPKGFQVPNVKSLFGLTDIGIKYVEGESIFDRTSAFSGINITNIGGLTVVGNNNVVRNEFIDTLRALNQLEGTIKISDQLSDEQKLNVQADIQTIKSQLSKMRPDKTILQKAMNGISFVGSLPGVAEVFRILVEAIKRIV